MTVLLDRNPKILLTERSIPQWVSMTWDEYEQWRDAPTAKTIYAALMIPEYWVIDVQGRRVLMFGLGAEKYQEVETSALMPGVTIALLEATITQWVEVTNNAAASWFTKQIS